MVYQKWVLQKVQLKDQLPEVASIRKIPKCARNIIKHPIKMRGRKLVRALFRDCSALAKFSGKHKLFVRLPNKTVRFVAPYGRFTISFGEQQYAKYSAVFFANSWTPIFCNIDTFAGSSNLVGYMGVKQVNGFILDSVFRKQILQGACPRYSCPTCYNSAWSQGEGKRWLGTSAIFLFH
jgi:hypothetical protein